MSVIRVILWMIIIYIAAKIVGQAIRYVRKIIAPQRTAVRNTAKDPEPYSNVEDVPYEEVPDKK